jgi:hypothetical protein
VAYTTALDGVACYKSVQCVSEDYFIIKVLLKQLALILNIEFKFVLGGSKI